MTRFSVVIPAYNAAPYIRQTLQSISEQSFRDFEVVVVDDGSIDETQEIVREFEGVRLITQVNAGPGGARNMGANHCEGDYIAFLDSDDLWFPWTLEAVDECIDRADGPELISLSLHEFYDLQDLQEVRKRPLRFEAFETFFASAEKGHFVGSGMTVVFRSAFLRAGGYRISGNFAEDWDLALRLGQCKGFVKVHAPVCVGYRRHSHSARSKFDRLYGGMQDILARETSNEYPGGRCQRVNRHRLITLASRALSLELVGAGEWQKSMKLYGQTFGMHVRLGRLKYLAGFPILIVQARLRKSFL